MASEERSPAAAIEAAALVPAPPQEVFAFLSDLGNHWRLASPFVEVVELETASGGDATDRGVVRLRGPLGLHRTARTTVTASRPPRLIIGTAEIAGGTRARVSWTMGQRLGQTRVRLAADLENAGALDRLLLALGARRWLERRFHETLAALAAELQTRAGDARLAVAAES